MRVRAGHCRSSGNVRDVRHGRLIRRLVGGYRFLGLGRLWQIAVRVALGQNLNGEVRAVALAEAAADAVRRLDDRVVRQKEAVLRADLDADIAAFAPLVDPADVDEVDDGGGEVWSPFGGVWSGRG
jgi:hypothetical protein